MTNFDLDDRNRPLVYEVNVYLVRSNLLSASYLFNTYETAERVADTIELNNCEFICEIVSQPILSELDVESMRGAQQTS